MILISWMEIVKLETVGMKFIRKLIRAWKTSGYYERFITLFLITFYVLVMFMMFGCGTEDGYKRVYPEDTRPLTEEEQKQCIGWDGQIIVKVRTDKYYTIDCDGEYAFPADIEPLE